MFFFKELCLLFFSNVPGATFIQGAMLIPESRVDVKNVFKCCKHFFGYFNILKTHSDTASMSLTSNLELFLVDLL